MAAVFDVITIGLHLTSYFYIALFLIVSGIVLYEAGPSPATQHPTSTPISIEIRERRRKPEVMDMTSSIVTDIAGNLSQNVGESPITEKNFI